MEFDRSNMFRQMIDRIGQDPGIPQDVLDQIQSSLSSPINILSLKRKMKELGMYRYYENISFIYYHLSSIQQPPMIPEDIKVEIMSRYSEIVRAHRIVFNGHRSFFNPTFLLTKIINEMRPFPGSIELILHLERMGFKSVQKRKCLEADWDAVVDFMMRPSTPSCGILSL